MLPGLNGLELVHAMRRAGLDTKVLLYTMHDSPAVISSALQAGVRGFVLKTDPESSLIHAVDALSTGKAYFSPAVTDGMLALVLGSEPNAIGDRLTHREREIVQLIAEGRLNKQIADQLGLQRKTVESHRARAMRRLNVRTTAEVVRWAIRHNLVLA